MTCNQSVAVKSIDPGSSRQISDVRFQMHCCHKPRPGSGKGRRATADRFLCSADDLSVDALSQFQTSGG
jgi:hypothetical protein